MIHYTMSSIHNIASYPGTLTWREEIIGRGGQVVDRKTGSGNSLAAQRAWFLSLERCRVDPEAYACRLVLLDMG